MDIFRRFQSPGDDSVAAMRALPPRAGNSNLLGVEGFFAALTARHARFAFEVFGVDGVVSYAARSRAFSSLDGMLTSCYPQAQLVVLDGRGRGTREPLTRDWLSPRGGAGGERWALPLHLSRSPELPLKFYTDQSLGRGETDPLASLLGFLASASSGAMRLGSRLLLRPLGADWSLPYQRIYQRRMDRQDLATSGRAASASRAAPEVDEGFLPGVPTSLLLAGMALLGIGYGNYWLYQENLLPLAVAGDLLLAGAAAGGFVGWRKLLGKDPVRAYFDEEMMALKLGSQGFAAELQLVVDAPPEADRRQVDRVFRDFMSIYQQFEFPAGNGWAAGKVRALTAPETGGGVAFGPDPLSPRRMMRSILCPRELATLWHLPVGETE